MARDWRVLLVPGIRLLCPGPARAFKWPLAFFVTACICLVATGACLHRLLQSDSRAARIYESVSACASPCRSNVFR